MSSNLQRLKQYEVQERLFSSGIAEVWKAFDPELKRPVALKIFNAHLQNDPVFMNRFRTLPSSQEAQKLLALRHAHIVAVHRFEISRPSASENLLAYVVLDDAALPFGGENAQAILQQHVTTPPPLPARSVRVSHLLCRQSYCAVRRKTRRIATRLLLKPRRLLSPLRFPQSPLRLRTIEKVPQHRPGPPL